MRELRLLKRELDSLGIHISSKWLPVRVKQIRRRVVGTLSPVGICRSGTGLGGTNGWRRGAQDAFGTAH